MAPTTSWLAALAAVVLVVGVVQGRKGYGDGGQEYGYVDVREGAHMFYWLFYANGADAPAGKPLVIWLQGGPGGSSTSFGNFEEIGPLDPFLKKRNSTWVNYVNLLFIDNPVGTGYSYVDHYSQMCTTNKQIADDLVTFTKAFLKEFPQFQKSPLYVFSESYGGKMAAEFVLYLYQEQKAGNVKTDVKGVALGDSWISPIDSVLTWAPYLLQTGMVDRRGFEAVDAVAQRSRVAVEERRFFKASQLWAEAEDVVLQWADNVDFYNIVNKIPVEQASRIRAAAERGDYLGVLHETQALRESGVDLDKLMDEKVKPVLGVIPDKVRHQSSSLPVFQTLSVDFMKPVTDIVERLLNETTVKVAVISGQLDLIVDTPGTLAWVERLQWKQSEYWRQRAERTPFVVDKIIEGFVKSAGTFSFYWVNRAGHMVPTDNPAGGIEVLRRITDLK